MKKIFTVLLLCATVFSSSCKKEDATATPVSGVTISKTLLPLLVGAKEQLSATVTPEAASDKSVAWSSSDASVATVSAGGEVTAVSAGTATITVASVADKTKTATCEVTVTNAVVVVTGVAVNKPTLSLQAGAKEQLSATVTPDNATDKSVAWSSSDASVATVSAAGEVTAVGAGKATITVASVADKTKTAACEVTVTNAVVAVTGVAINKPTLSLQAGAKEQLSATVTPDNATDKSVAWSSSDASVATVSAGGEVTAVGAGTATITVASVADKTKTAACVVTITVPVETTATVGNFYYSDKTQSKIFDKTKSCIGIVFWVDPADATKGKIVSLDQEDLAWSGKVAKTNASNNSNGRANMYLLNEFVKSSNSRWTDYPAFNWVAITKNKRVTGGWVDTDMWWLPAQGDLVALRGAEGATMQSVNASLNSVPGAVPLTLDFYCSSTEQDDSNAIFVSFSTGLSQGLIKISANKVRAIAAF